MSKSITQDMRYTRILNIKRSAVRLIKVLAEPSRETSAPVKISCTAAPPLSFTAHKTPT